MLNAYAVAHTQADPADRPQIDAVVDRIRALATARERLPWSALAALPAALLHPKRDQAEVTQLTTAILDGTAPADSLDDLAGLLDDLLQDTEPPAPCRPVDVAGLADVVIAAYDPTRPDASARTRVLSQITGLDPGVPTSPPEVCPGIDLPAWRLLNESAPDLLLPGVTAIGQDTVIALQTNPAFVDAFLAGLNTQLLAELRWRNIPVDTGCTPVRVFWDRTDVGSGTRVDDITGIPAWATASTVGDAQHQPDGVGGADLVLVFRGQLFLRYPHTLLRLISAEHGGLVDFDRDPADDAALRLPTLQGRVGADITFFGFQDVPPAEIERFWVALEEPPAGYRFHNDVPEAATATDAADFAHRAFADPVRVLIPGASLIPGGNP